MPVPKGKQVPILFWEPYALSFRPEPPSVIDSVSVSRSIVEQVIQGKGLRAMWPEKIEKSMSGGISFLNVQIVWKKMC